MDHSRTLLVNNPPDTEESRRALYQAVIDGHLAAADGKFPPSCPHAPFGLPPGAGKGTKAEAWFFGYWAFFKPKEEGR
jgi:hypothetical protein